MFLPMTRKECEDLGWSELDVILVSGDAYVDSSYFGVAVIGKTLLSKGYKVGIISQPDVNSDSDIMRLGEPKLFWGISGGAVDSMVSNYTPLKKHRMDDDLTPGGRNTKRPDRACIAYSNLIRRFSSVNKPVVLGGIEASLRRIAHYDFWSDSVRRSILFDAKADILVYGMSERTIVELAEHFERGEDWHRVLGICYAAKSLPDDAQEIPSYEDSVRDKDSFIAMFKAFYENNDSLTAKKLAQRHGDRFLVQNPPQYLLSPDELDDAYELDYERDAHPSHKADGEVRALETIRFSITTHRGCYGECRFCAISVHQGRTVVSRSVESIVREAECITHLPKFKGIISDLGGPTANMYGFECEKKTNAGACRNKRCLQPSVCRSLKVRHDKQVKLLRAVRALAGVKRVFVASGVRYDLVFADPKGEEYLEELVASHISGQMKIAPEHTKGDILVLMGKPPKAQLIRFKKLFDQMNERLGRKQFLTYYFIAAHPGCNESDMHSLGDFSRHELRHRPEQVQIFTPTPSTWSTLFYYTGFDPFSVSELFVERDPRKKQMQKDSVRNSPRPSKY